MVRKSAPYLDGSLAGGIGAMAMDYLGGFHYQGIALKFFPTAEGYVQKTGTKYSYVYNYTDHLGNIRLSYAQDPENPNVLKIIEESHYYPFGLKHANYNSDLLAFRGKAPGPGIMLKAAPVNPVPQFNYDYKYNGQEWQDEIGLNWYTYRYRNYDPTIGRFMGIDPISEQYYTISNFQFAHNNPVWKIELEGLEGATSNETKDIVNKEPVYMSRNIILKAIEINSTKEKHIRADAPLIEFGFQGGISKSKSIGSDNLGASGTATAVEGKIGMSVYSDGERIEYNLTIGQAGAEGHAVGENVEGNVTVFSASGSYHKNGESVTEINYLTGSLDSSLVGQETSIYDDLIIELNTMGVYINTNITQMGNTIEDTVNFILSWMESVIEGNMDEEGAKTNPITN